MQATAKQQEIIDHKSGNLLVSAGAGSGKTSVLTQHIISRIESGISIDRMLVMTFTTAAAEEMKSRIRDELEKKAIKNEDAYLLSQVKLVPSADIGTIDGFCNKVYKRFFYETDADPGTRIADEGELKLLKYDICSQMLEGEYESDDEGVKKSFLNFIKVFSGNDTDDKKTTEIIIGLYDKSRAFPDPEEYIKGLASPRADYVQELREQVKKDMDDCLLLLKQLRDFARENDLPTKVCEQFEESYIAFKSILGSDKSYSQMQEDIAGFSFKRKAAPTKKDQAQWDGKEALTEHAYIMRDVVKDRLAEIKNGFIAFDENYMELEKHSIQLLGDELIRLTLKFSGLYEEAKKKRCICDFSDIELGALQILSQNGDPTKAAAELSELYDEVLVDEYQDCNDLQDMIIRSVSRQYRGENNVFMVGDVKQSIYGFRQSNPGLFIDKFNTYKENDESNKKVELCENFRSRSGVIAFINDLFGYLMKKRLGGIDYKTEGRLDSKAVIYPARSGFDAQLGILITNGAGDDGDADDDTDEQDKYELEAAFTANKILKLLNPDAPYMVTENKQLRPVAPSDIVILMRSVSTAQDAYVRVFREYGIPLYCESEKGYYTSVEVSGLLDLLSIIDNIRQDIPLAATMRNVFGAFSMKELADIKLLARKKGIKHFHEAVFELRSEFAKIDKFLCMIERYRALSQLLPISELLLKILDETGYVYYVNALPAGKRRMKNVDALIESAKKYEQSSFSGTGNFIRYIERLKDYDKDDAPAFNETVDAVRLMTIHKSKGLEFPVVIVTCCGKTYNTMDLKAAFLTSDEYGIGCDVRDGERRFKVRSLKKKMIRRRLLRKLAEEEMRLLYVACTRAKELLIMTGILKENAKQDKLKSLTCPPLDADGTLADDYIAMDSGSYLNMIAGAVFDREAKVKGIGSSEICSSDETELEYGGYRLKIYKQNAGDILPPVDAVTSKEEADENAGLDKKLRRILEFRYRNQVLTSIPANMSVTDIKKASMEEMPEDDDTTFVRVGQTSKDKAARRGTAYHKLMELMELGTYDGSGIRYVSQQIERAIGEGLNAEDAKLIDRRNIAEFFDTRLGKRMIGADRNGTLFRERQFLMGVAVKDIYKDIDLDDNVLVRGIIDAYFIENDELILIDYKTDYTEDVTGRELVDRYRAQLIQYKIVLERVYGRKVKEVYIYSFCLGKEFLM
ncbi:MAG: helicase-exonuclease AddAB subunit AddA [Lachnospiraceae bacterium]|nr:helicase-exonuclease AddAB subunit AddA [Lachnospiraceae bacterium]